MSYFVCFIPYRIFWVGGLWLMERLETVEVFIRQDFPIYVVLLFAQNLL